MAAILFTNPGLSEPQALIYAQQVESQTTEQGVDPWLVDAIIERESKWRRTVFRREHDGSCSVGLGQINVRNCDPQKTDRLRDPLENIRRTTLQLAMIKKICPKVWKKNRCQGLGWVGLYNPGDRRYARAIQRSMEVRRASFATGQVRVEVHEPDVSGAGRTGSVPHNLMRTARRGSSRP